MIADKPTKATPKLVAKPTKLASNPVKHTENPAKPIMPAPGMEDDVDMLAGQPKLAASFAKTAPNPAQPTINLAKRVENLAKPVTSAFGTEMSANFEFQLTSPVKQAKKRKLDTLEGKGPKKTLSQRPTSTASKVEQASGYIQQALQLLEKAAATSPIYADLVGRVKSLVKNEASKPAQIQPALPAKELLFSTVAKKGMQTGNQAKAQAQQSQPRQAQPQPQQAQPKPKSSQVILLAEKSAQQPALDSQATRDKINQVFQAPVVARVEKSVRGNIVVTTTSKYSADTLLAKVDSWKGAFQGFAVKSVEKPTTWIKLVAHGVPVRPFTAIDNGLKLFSGECKVFNPVQILGQPRWLVSPGEGKLAGSVVFAVGTEAEKRHCLQNGLSIAGVSVKVVNYKLFSPKSQCYCCQGYGYNPHTCKNKPKCRYCAGQH
jgi:hypothetical protein